MGLLRLFFNVYFLYSFGSSLIINLAIVPSSNIWISCCMFAWRSPPGMSVTYMYLPSLASMAHRSNMASSYIVGDLVSDFVLFSLCGLPSAHPLALMLLSGFPFGNINFHVPCLYTVNSACHSCNWFTSFNSASFPCNWFTSSNSAVLIFFFPIILLCIPVIFNVSLCICGLYCVVFENILVIIFHVVNSCNIMLYIFCVVTHTCSVHSVISGLLSGLLLFGLLFYSGLFSSFIILASLLLNIMPLSSLHADWTIANFRGHVQYHPVVSD